MIATRRRLLSLAEVSRARIALAVTLGTLTVVFGIGLMATAGFLISRAAERPAVLSLTVAIVAVHFFGLARPVGRYFERLTSHDVAFRALTQAREQIASRRQDDDLMLAGVRDKQALLQRIKREPARTLDRARMDLADGSANFVEDVD